MATNDSVNVGLSGVTGTGNFVGATSPTLITPTLGVATATSLAFNPTTGGIIGTTAADNAGSGYVGQVITSNVPSGSAVSLTNNTAANITSISLTAGDWDVYGNILFNASVSASAYYAWCSTTSATEPNSSLIAGINVAAIGFAGLATPILRVNISSTTTCYLSCIQSFATGTCTGCGTIYARRAR